MNTRAVWMVAGLGLVGAICAVALAMVWRGELTDVRAQLQTLAASRKVDPAPAAAPAPTRLDQPLPPLIAPSAKRVAELESEVRVLRQSIDRLGKALGEIAMAGDRTGRLGGDGGVDPLSALLSDDPDRQSLFRNAVGSAIRQLRRQRWRRRAERRAGRVAAVVADVAKGQGWSTERTEQASGIVKDLQKDIRQAFRGVWRGDQSPGEVALRIDGILGDTRDRLQSLLGPGDYEAFRQAYNQRQDQWRALRSQRSAKLPPAK